ncbi:MAG: putative metallopeptidase [Candidatus Bathycorpusculaceae bacterium]
MVKYYKASDVKKRVDEIADILELFNVVPQFVYCVRSRGSKSRRTVARIHGLGRIWQEALNLPPSYVIEVISEKFGNLSEEEKEKTLIHELFIFPLDFLVVFVLIKGLLIRKLWKNCTRSCGQ